MTILIMRLLVDFGLVVLIWMVQLIIYPSFQYYQTENLIKWHKKYTSLIGIIVSPLMLLQLGIAIFQIIITQNTVSIINFTMIVVIWIVTFLQFVPIHNSISKGIVTDKMLSALVKKNWIRTILWSFVCILNLIVFLQMKIF